MGFNHFAHVLDASCPPEVKRPEACLVPYDRDGSRQRRSRTVGGARLPLRSHTAYPSTYPFLVRPLLCFYFCFCFRGRLGKACGSLYSMLVIWLVLDFRVGLPRAYDVKRREVVQGPRVGIGDWKFTHASKRPWKLQKSPAQSSYQALPSPPSGVGRQGSPKEAKILYLALDLNENCIAHRAMWIKENTCIAIRFGTKKEAHYASIRMQSPPT